MPDKMQSDLPIHNRRGSERGQSLVELSLVMIGVLMFLAGAADLGRMYFIHLTLRDAAQEGAAYGATDPANSSEIEARVLDAVGDTLDPAEVTVSSGPTIPPYECAGIVPSTLEANAISVTASYNMPIAVPFLGTIIGSNELPLSATVENTILTPPCP
ncbi:MAG: TadE family protein [Anaerolineales bacterium]|nr:TadE family protein [Anaerolineales bacterium]